MMLEFAPVLTQGKKAEVEAYINLDFFNTREAGTSVSSLIAYDNNDLIDFSASLK